MNEPIKSSRNKNKNSKGRSPLSGGTRDVVGTQTEVGPSAKPVSLPSLLLPLNPEQRFRAILNNSLSNGAFYDTKFYVFSRRNPSGRVDRPLSIFANSAILRAQSPYFTHLLAGGFSESHNADLHGDFPSDKLAFNDQYDYWEDSDLEDELENDGEEVDKENASAQLSKDDSESSEDQPASVKENPISNPDRTQPGRLPGRVIIKPDVAYATFRALVFWLHTRQITFAPLHSQGCVVPRNPGNLHEPYLCSPKSMYRLASELELEELKKLAKDNITNKLTATNVLPELFSEFASLYPEIQDSLILFIRNSGERARIKKEFQEWSTAIARGELPHGSQGVLKLTAALIA